MKKLSMAVAMVLGLVSFTGVAQAAECPAKRQRNEQVRINEGVRSGELNRREATRLEAQHLKIRHDLKEARADGQVTPRERAKLEREQNRLSRRIYAQKHDAQTR